MKKIFSFCGPYLKNHWGRLFFLVFLFITASLLSVVLPYLTGNFVDALISGEAAELLGRYIAVIAELAVTEFGLSFICERLYIGIQCSAGHALNADAIHHIQNLPFSYMQDRNTSFLNRQINNDANALVIFCITVLQNVLSSILTLVIPLALIFRMEPWLGVAMLAVNLIYYALYHFFRGPVYRAQHELMDEQADYFSKLDMQISNVRFVQTHGLARSYITRLTQSLNRLLGKAYKVQLAQYGFGGSDVIMKHAANILVFLLGGRAVLRGEMSVGDFTIVLSYFSMSLSATQYFFSLGRDIQSSLVSCDRLKAIFDECEQTNGTEQLEDIEEIECSEISFSYGEEKVFSDLNMRFEKGGVYAFMGDNGSGKSTLIQLLLGLFIDSYEGEVRYNGIPIEDLDMRMVRQTLVGVSEQEPLLLEDTLRFNLTLDDHLPLDEAAFRELCGILNLGSFLSSLPKGLDTVVCEGTTNLSGGEKQKMSIIRALLKRPKLLVLDEPTSAMDRESRKRFVEYLGSIRRDKIIFISTHDEDLLKICTGTIRLGPREAAE